MHCTCPEVVDFRVLSRGDMGVVARATIRERRFLRRHKDHDVSMVRDGIDWHYLKTGTPVFPCVWHGYWANNQERVWQYRHGHPITKKCSATCPEGGAETER